MRFKLTIMLVFLSLPVFSGCTQKISLNKEPIYSVNVSPINSDKPFLNSLEVQFLGNSTLFFTDVNGGVAIDGFLSRPSFLKLMFGKVKSDLSIVNEVLLEAKINNKIEAVIPLHSHFDHIVDAPNVAKKLNACLIVDDVGKSIAKSYEPITFCKSDFWYDTGYENKDLSNKFKSIQNDTYTRASNSFKIEISDALHSQTGAGQYVAPLVGRVDDTKDFSKKQRANNYPEGRSINVFIEHLSGVKFFVIGGEFKRADSRQVSFFEQADVVFIPVPLMNKRRNPKFYDLVSNLLTRKSELRKTVIPIHWDNLTKKIRTKRLTSSKDNKKIAQHSFRSKQLDEFFPLRSAITDTQNLVDDGIKQYFDLVWITAYDKLTFSENRKID